jgi:hypothetical protein
MAPLGREHGGGGRERVAAVCGAGSERAQTPRAGARRGLAAAATGKERRGRRRGVVGPTCKREREGDGARLAGWALVGRNGLRG